MKAVCTQTTGSQVENRFFVGLSLLSHLFSYNFLYCWTYFLPLPMIFSVLFLCHPLLFSFLAQCKAVPAPLEALALVSVNFFSPPVQRAVNFNRHNITRLFIPPVSLCFYRSKGSRKKTRVLSSFASFSQPILQDPARRVSYPTYRHPALITEDRRAAVIQTGHQVAPFFFWSGTLYCTGWTHPSHFLHISGNKSNTTFWD